MRKTMIEQMREEWTEFFEKYPDAVLVEQYEYCLPVQDCYIPAFVEFPKKVTFKDGSVKYFETTFGGMTDNEIEYKDYQLKFLMPYNGSRGGERLCEKEATEWLDRAIAIFSYEQDGEAYDTLHFLKSRKDEIGAIAHLFLGVLNLYLSVMHPSYYREWESSEEKEVYSSIACDEFRLALHTALNGGEKALKVLPLIGKFGKIVVLREKGQRVAVETVRGLFFDSVKLWTQLKNKDLV